MSRNHVISSLRTPWGEEEKRKTESCKKLDAEINSKENENISKAVRSFLDQFAKKQATKSSYTTPQEGTKKSSSGINNWVRRKTASKSVAAYSQVDNTNISKAVEHTSARLQTFQKHRFSYVESDDDDSDEENPIDISKFGTISSASCHSISSIHNIHGLWHTDFSRDNKVRLAHITGYSTVELSRMFIDFNTLCSLSETPYGITWKTFRNVLPLFSVEDPLFAGRVFEFLDDKERGLWRWEEYLLCMTLIFRSSRVLRTYFLFKIYDIDDDETLSKDELFHFFVASLVVKVDSHLLEVSKTFVTSLFSNIDKDCDGEISLDETLLYVHECEEIEEVSTIFGRTIATNYTHGRWSIKSSRSMDSFHYKKIIEKRSTPAALFQKLRDDIAACTCADAQKRIETHLNDEKVRYGVGNCYRM